jgi:hypothetical protein
MKKSREAKDDLSFDSRLLFVIPIDAVANNSQMPLLYIIPMKTGIRYFKGATDDQDSRFRGNDG